MILYIYVYVCLYTCRSICFVSVTGLGTGACRPRCHFGCTRFARVFSNLYELCVG